MTQVESDEQIFQRVSALLRQSVRINELSLQIIKTLLETLMDSAERHREDEALKRSLERITQLLNNAGEITP